MSIWSAIGAIGGAFLNRRSANKDRARQDNQLQRMVADAKAAGIAPLAALGSSAASQYAAPVGSLNTGNLIGDAAQQLGRHFTPERKLALEKAEKEIDFLQAQTNAANAQAASVATSRSQVSPNRTPPGSVGNPIPTHVYVHDTRKNAYGWMLNPALGMDVGEMGGLQARLPQGLTKEDINQLHQQMTPRARFTPKNQRFTTARYRFN